MIISAQQRQIFMELSDLVLPPWQHMPGAASLGLDQGALEKAMAIRPDLESAVVAGLDAMTSPVDACQISALQQNQPQSFRALIAIVCATYYAEDTVRDALGYHGQQALSLPRGGFGGEALLLEMMNEPKRYRAPPEE
jgi:hypothetical protein